MTGHVLALCGGVGGAKLAFGLAQVLAAGAMGPAVGSTARGGPGAKSLLAGRLPVKRRGPLVETMLADTPGARAAGRVADHVSTPTPTRACHSARARVLVILEPCAWGLNDVFKATVRLPGGGAQTAGLLRDWRAAA